MNTRKNRSLCLVALAVAALHFGDMGRQACYAQTNSESVAGTHVSLMKPRGFIAASNFSGFQDASSGSSIMVTEIPGPYSKVTAGFNAEGLASRGMRLLSSEPTSFGARAGLLIHVSQQAYGKQFEKWMGAFGDESNTVMVTATFPADKSAALGEELKRAVLSTAWNATQQVNPTAALNYTVGQVPGLKMAGRMQNMLIYTVSGQVVSKSPDDPVLVIGQSFSTVSLKTPEEQKAYSEKRFLQVEKIKDAKIDSIVKLNVSGYPAYEITGKAQDVRTGKPIAIYQTMVFAGNTYFIVQGLVSPDAFGTWARSFQLAARTLKVKA